jgi:hypothetical protein
MTSGLEPASFQLVATTRYNGIDFVSHKRLLISSFCVFVHRYFNSHQGRYAQGNYRLHS